MDSIKSSGFEEILLRVPQPKWPLAFTVLTLLTATDLIRCSLMLKRRAKEALGFDRHI